MIDVCYQKRNSVWYAAATKENQVFATDFSLEKSDINRIQRKLPQDTPFQVMEEPNQFTKKILGALEEIFNGKDKKDYGFKISMGLLSGYSRKVLDCTSMIPVGYVTTYAALAKAAGGSARSVGQVEASNPVPLLIPCHRVVRSDLSVGGYGYGEQTKRGILQREKRGYEESMTLEVDDKKLVLFPSQWVK